MVFFFPFFREGATKSNEIAFPLKGIKVYINHGVRNSYSSTYSNVERPKKRVLNHRRGFVSAHENLYQTLCGQ